MTQRFLADRFQPLPGPSRRERLLRSHLISRPASFGAACRPVPSRGPMPASLAALPVYLPPLPELDPADRLHDDWGVLLTLATIIEARDPYMSGHSQRTGWLAARLGRQIGLSGRDIEILYLAGILHDIGKLGIPEAILNKPGPLTDDEMNVVRHHPAMGCEMLRPVQWLAPVLPAVRHHHENYDGSGYPERLAGEQIPLSARILRIVDMFDALTSPRPYRPPRSHGEALRILRDGTGTLTDPSLTRTFIRMLERNEPLPPPAEHHSGHTGGRGLD